MGKDDAMTSVGDFKESTPLRAAIQVANLADEETCVETLISKEDPGLAERLRIGIMATSMVERIRGKVRNDGGFDALMHE